MTIHCTFTIVQGAIKRLLETIFFSLLSKDFFPKFFRISFKSFFPSVVATFRIVSHPPFTTQSQPNATFIQPQKHRTLTPNKKHIHKSKHTTIMCYKNTLFVHFLQLCLLIFGFHSSTSNRFTPINIMHSHNNWVILRDCILFVENCVRGAVPGRDTFIYHNNGDNSILAQS